MKRGVIAVRELEMANTTYVQYEKRTTHELTVTVLEDDSTP